MTADTAGLAALFAGQADTMLAWRTSPARARVERIRRLVAAIQSHREAMLAAAAADFRRPGPEVTLTELAGIAHEAKTAIRHTARWMRPRYCAPTLGGLGTSARIQPQARGRALIVSPWNYPYVLTFGPLISALAAGCPCIIKPSETSPAQSAVIARIIAAAFPATEVAVVEGDTAIASALLELPFDHIFFTGSTSVGRIVMDAAARHLSSVTLELGGKTPVIVDASADLEQAARLIMSAKFINNGQTCIAPDHVYVDRRVYDAFVTHCQASLRQIYGADAAAQMTSPDLARVVSSRHTQRLIQLLQEATARGAQVLCGGSYDATERFIAPTLLANVPADCALMQTEIFGPLLPLIPYESLDAVIGGINAGPKPLAMYVWSKDSRMTRQVVAATSSGGVCINHCLIQFAHGNVPFGGINASGLGNSHGYWGFAAFSHERAVVKSRVMVADRMFAPYDKFKRWAIDWLAR